MNPSSLAHAFLRGGPAALQGRMIFGRPTRIRPLALGPHAGGYRTTPHHLERPDGVVLEGWSSTPLAGQARTVVLYFGGRNEHVAWAPDMGSFLPGHAIYAFNYRGFGGSTGWPSERHARQDAEATHAYLVESERQALHAQDAQLVVMGRSLGTALAIGLAHQLAEQGLAPARLVLMSPFESVPHVLRSRRMGWAVAPWMAPWIGQRFDCTARAPACGGETLVLLAERDPFVPHAQSLRLCAHLPRAPLIHTIAGTTHQTLPRSAGAQAAIARFLAGPAAAG